MVPHSSSNNNNTATTMSKQQPTTTTKRRFKRTFEQVVDFVVAPFVVSLDELDPLLAKKIEFFVTTTTTATNTQTATVRQQQPTPNWRFEHTYQHDCIVVVVVVTLLFGRVMIAALMTPPPLLVIGDGVVVWFPAQGPRFLDFALLYRPMGSHFWSFT